MLCTPIFNSENKVIGKLLVDDSVLQPMLTFICKFSLVTPLREQKTHANNYHDDCFCVICNTKSEFKFRCYGSG